MEIDYSAEWQRLTQHYAAVSDEELRELAAQFGDLTEIAQQVLRDEMRKRKLGDPSDPRRPEEQREVTRWADESWSSKSQAFVPAPQSLSGPGLPGIVPPSQWDTAPDQPEDDNGDEEEDQEREYTWKTLLCECETPEEAWQIHEVLRRAGIESWIEAPPRYATVPRVIVAADQLDQARQIAAQPIPQDIVDESKMTMPEFESPRCPRCKAEDPVLESVEPSNHWSCESCGYEWSEPVKDLDENGAAAPR
jgi:hypothetical protein